MDQDGLVPLCFEKTRDDFAAQSRLFGDQNSARGLIRAVGLFRCCLGRGRHGCVLAWRRNSRLELWRACIGARRCRFFLGGFFFGILRLGFADSGFVSKKFIQDIEQFIHLNRFGDVFVQPFVEKTFTVPFERIGGQGNDGDMWLIVFPFVIQNGMGGLHAIHHRHLNIHENNIVRAVFPFFKCFLTVVCQVRFQPHAFKNVLNQSLVDGIVFRDQGSGIKEGLGDTDGLFLDGLIVQFGFKGPNQFAWGERPENDTLLLDMEGLGDIAMGNVRDQQKLTAVEVLQRLHGLLGGMAGIGDHQRRGLLLKQGFQVRCRNKCIRSCSQKLQVFCERRIERGLRLTDMLKDIDIGKGILEPSVCDRNLFKRKREKEGAAFAFFAFDIDMSAHQFDVLFGDSQSQTGPAVFACGIHIRLGERFEDLGDLLLGHADPGIADAELYQGFSVFGVEFLDIQSDGPSGTGEFDGIVEEVDEYFTDLGRISFEFGADAHIKVVIEVDLFFRCRSGKGLDGRFKFVIALEGDIFYLNFVAFDFGKIQDIIDDPQEVLGAFFDDVDELLLLFGCFRRFEELRKSDDAVHGGSDLV